MDKLNISWEQYQTSIDKLAQQIEESRFDPDIVMGIARGGLFAAGSLSYALNIKNIFVVNLEFYTKEGETLDHPIMLPPYIDFNELNELKVLLVDDIADSGQTLRSVHNHCKGIVKEAHTAVLFEKPESIVKCTFVGDRVPQDQWINFPWDR